LLATSIFFYIVEFSNDTFFDTFFTIQLIPLQDLQFHIKTNGLFNVPFNFIHILADSTLRAHNFLGICFLHSRVIYDFAESPLPNVQLRVL